MVLAKKYVVPAPFQGLPLKDDFIIVEEELPAVSDGEFLAEAAYLSVDPYQRVKLGNKFPCDMIGGQIAIVTESKCADYPVGTWVMGHFGWRTHTVVNPGFSGCPQKPYLYALPDFQGLPESLGIGVLGRVGNTAYFGFTQICQPKAGDTVAVTAAAGAVGSHVGQIAKILGCRVVGFAGSDDKCKWLVEELGFDAVANYKTTDVLQFLTENAQNGIDCFFDNVGGELSSAIISRMNPSGRVAVCGAIASYGGNGNGNNKVTPIQPFIVAKELKIEGFQVNRFASRTLEGVRQNLQWVKEGKLKYREHNWQGFESAPEAFAGLFTGVNIGKAIVKVK